MRTGPYNARQKAVQQRLYGEGPELPPRLVNRGHLSWLNTYTTQLQAEGKSVNTQKSYMIGLRHLIETPLPGEDILSEFERDSMSVLRDIQVSHRPEQSQLLWQVLKNEVFT